MAQVISNAELPNNGSVYTFEGYQYGDVDVSFFLSDTAPIRDRICTSTPTMRSSWCKRASSPSRWERTPLRPPAARS
jgi:hypothetical protein